MVPSAQPRSPPRSQAQSPSPCSGRATPLPVGKSFTVPRGTFGPKGVYTDGGALLGMFPQIQHSHFSEMAVNQFMSQLETLPRRASVPAPSPRSIVPAGMFRAASLPRDGSQKVMHADSPHLIQGVQSCNAVIGGAAPMKTSEFAKPGRKAAKGYPIYPPKELSSSSSTQCPSLQGSFRSPPSSVPSRMASGDRRTLFECSPRGSSRLHAGSVKVPNGVASAQGSVKLPNGMASAQGSVKVPNGVASAQDLLMTERSYTSGERSYTSGPIFPPSASFPVHTPGLVSADSFYGAFSPRVHGAFSPRRVISREEMHAKGQLFRIQDKAHLSND